MKRQASVKRQASSKKAKGLKSRILIINVLKDKGAVAFRHNRIKNRGIVQ